MVKYRVDTLLDLYTKHNGIYLAMERDVVENTVRGVPKTRESLKKYCELLEIPAKYQQIQAENTKIAIAKYKAKKADLLDLCWEIIERYKEQLLAKGKVTDQSFLMAWKILKVEMNEPIYVKSKEPIVEEPPEKRIYRIFVTHPNKMVTNTETGEFERLTEELIIDG